MVGGFNLIGFDENIEELESLSPYIRTKEIDYNKQIQDCIVNDEIDAEKLQNEVFPIEHKDIFISHSHNDEKLAIKLKYWIEKKLKMTCFLDKEIWGSCNNTLKIIDKRCWKDDRGCYDYNERNLTTSYVHVMLCNAIMQGMNSCKFAFFLNTPSSIDPDSAWSDPKTYSPWLFYELSVLKYIQKEPTRIIKSSSAGMENFNESINTIMRYPAVDLANLPQLEFADLQNFSLLSENTRLESLLNMLEQYK